MLFQILLSLTLLLPSLASITPISTTSSTLLTFGTAQTTQNYILTSANRITSITIDAPTRSVRPILSNFVSSSSRVRDGVYNITVDMHFESWVGNFDYAVIVDTVSSNGVKESFSHVDTHAVYGLVLFQSDDTIVSGDEAAGVSFDHFLSDGDEGKTVQVVTYAPEGVDMTAKLTSRDTFSKGSRLLNENALKLNNGVLTIRPRDFTVGSAVVDIMCPGLEIDGEVYESVLMVSVSGPDGPVVLRKATAMVLDNSTVVEGVVWNGGKNVVLMINGSRLAGKKIGDEVYKFSGVLNEGIYEDITIVKAGVEGRVKKGLVIEVLGNARNREMVTGKNGGVGFMVVLMIVIAVMVVLTIVGIAAYKRSVKTESVFIDGRPVHIARDVYGRSSLHV